MKPSLSTIMCNFLQPLLLFFPLAQGPSPWMDKPVLSTIRCRGCLELTLRFNIGFKVLLLLDNVVWSGIGRETFIISNSDLTNPSVCLRGRWNNSLKVRMVSIARSEYFCCLPCLPDFFDFHDLIAFVDNHRVTFPLSRSDCSYWDQFFTLYFALYFGFLLRLWAVSYTHLTLPTTWSV